MQEIKLSEKAAHLDVGLASLREYVVREVLSFFKMSLSYTLYGAACLLLIDSCFILFKIIQPSQRLMTESVVMTFISATVVQVGAALGAIVIAVFKTPNDSISEIAGIGNNNSATGVEGKESATRQQ